MRVVVAGTEGATGRQLADHYRREGASVTEVGLRSGSNLGLIAAELGSQPIDLLVLSDNIEAPDCRLADLSRAELQAAFERLTFAPFRLAALLRPNLAAAEGTLVLLTRESAAMGFRDTRGRYLERPFRAAAHALWRCYSIEWAPYAISCVLLAIDDEREAAEIAATIKARTAEVPLTLRDARGGWLSW